MPSPESAFAAQKSSHANPKAVWPRHPGKSALETTKRSSHHHLNSRVKVVDETFFVITIKGIEVHNSLYPERSDERNFSEKRSPKDKSMLM
ncbi:MAG: hypothetical protein IPN96_15925 [Anaerolineales bacterium]|nr:hypothetical protein [Anaerolineales bacterium]